MDAMTAYTASLSDADLIELATHNLVSQQARTVAEELAGRDLTGMSDDDLDAIGEGLMYGTLACVREPYAEPLFRAVSAEQDRRLLANGLPGIGTETEAPKAYAVGTRVAFKPETPQYAANREITYVVTESPTGEPFSTDHEGRRYLWLTDERDLAKSPSRRRGRTGWADALTEVR